MKQIQELIALLQKIIALGAVARGIYCVMAIIGNVEEEQSYRTRIKHLLIFVVLAETIGGIVQLVLGYFV